MKLPYLLLIVCLLAACAPATIATPVPEALPSPRVLYSAKPSVTPFPSPTRAPTWTPEPSVTPAGLLFTPDPNSQYSIPALRLRQYGGGQVENLGVMGENDYFIRYSIRYPSDGLSIYGFMNVPKGQGPFPIIIGLHGYADPLEYESLDYTTGTMDDIAKDGYIVLHPNLRNFRPSDSGDALFRAGYAIDVLNLIALARDSAGKPGLFEQANANRIGIWGHSMGAGIALKVAVISPLVRAILLYAGTSGDEQKNSQFFNNFVGSPENQREILSSPETFAIVSPDRFYRGISAAVQLHHGTADSVIPIDWASENCQSMRAAGVRVECYFYDGADHTFRIRYLVDYGPRVTAFFAENLKK